MLSSLRRFSLPLSRLLSSQAATPLKRSPQDVSEYFKYSRAIVASQSSLDHSFAQQSLRFAEPADPIDTVKARQDHSDYVVAIKKLIPEVHIVPYDPSFPDQVFVEDPAVVLNGTAFITPNGPMKPRSRAGEGGPLRRVLEDLGLSVAMASDPNAAMDGGDVLFTGREFLVGLSKRTNAVSMYIRNRVSASLIESWGLLISSVCVIASFVRVIAPLLVNGEIRGCQVL